MDNLHEDLNLVLKKPYIEIKDFDPKQMQLTEYAALCKSNYRARENSVMTDLFYGQLMSRITCPDCNHISITLDPFNMISVPLTLIPIQNYTLYLMDEADMFKLVKIVVQASPTATFSEIRKCLLKSDDF